MDPRENLTDGEALYPGWNEPEKIEEPSSLTPVDPLGHTGNQSQPSVADILYPGDESVKPVREVRPMSPENIAYRERARHWGSEAAKTLYPNMGAAEEAAGRRLMEAGRRKWLSQAGSAPKPNPRASRKGERVPDWEAPPPEPKRAPPFDPARVGDKTYRYDVPDGLYTPDYRDRIAAAETNQTGYREVYPDTAWDRYQLTKAGLRSIKMMDENDNWTGYKYGITNEKQFLNNPEVQEKAFQDYTLENESQLSSNGSYGFIGQ